MWPRKELLATSDAIEIKIIQPQSSFWCRSGSIFLADSIRNATTRLSLSLLRIPPRRSVTLSGYAALCPAKILRLKKMSVSPRNLLFLGWYLKLCHSFKSSLSLLNSFFMVKWMMFTRKQIWIRSSCIHPPGESTSYHRLTTVELRDRWLDQRELFVETYRRRVRVWYSGIKKTSQCPYLMFRLEETSTAYQAVVGSVCWRWGMTVQEKHPRVAGTPSTLHDLLFLQYAIGTIWTPALYFPPLDAGRSRIHSTSIHSHPADMWDNSDKSRSTVTLSHSSFPFGHKKIVWHCIYLCGAL